MTDSFPEYFKYWGKADRDDPAKYHLLPFHCLDVAAVGWWLLDPLKPLCQQISGELGVRPAWLQKWFCFCLSLHDLGKFATAFQGIISHESKNLVPSNSRMPYTERHDTLGFWLWRENLFARLEKSLSNKAEWLKRIVRWLEIVTGHHGMPPKKSGGRISNFFELEDEEAANQFEPVQY